MRCPHCDGILSDEWVKKAGATLMGMTSGAAKARKSSGKAANKRWEKAKKEGKWKGFPLDKPSG